MQTATLTLMAAAVFGNAWFQPTVGASGVHCTVVAAP
jgi:hypothetical protein